jgi:hypothetical protein
LPIAVGIIEFIIAAILFFVGGSSITGYVVVSRSPSNRGDPLFLAQLGLGIFALIAFFCGLVGSVSAFMKKNSSWAILASCLALIWGVSLDWYALAMVTNRENLNIMMAIGNTVIFMSSVSLTFLIVSKSEFGKKHSDVLTSQ